MMFLGVTSIRESSYAQPCAATKSAGVLGNSTKHHHETYNYFPELDERLISGLHKMAKAAFEVRNVVHPTFVSSFGRKHDWDKKKISTVAMLTNRAY